MFFSSENSQRLWIADSRAEPRYRSFCQPCINQQNHTFLEFLAPCAGASGLLLRPHPARPTATMSPRRLCLRRELPEPGAHNFACGANYHIPVWFNFACGANYHIPGWFNYACGANYHIPGWFNYACGANYPYQALKGGLFCICVESTNLT